MLELKELQPSSEKHQFYLTSIIPDEEISFELTSETYTGLTLNFKFDYPKQKIPKGYTVDVHLFKNIYANQKDIIELRINELTKHKGRIGYFFRLDGLFEKDILQIDEHIYPFAYYAIEHLLSKEINLQTIDLEINSENYKITDFFDEDTIILVICNQNTSSINNFTINDYLPALYLNGFVKYDKSTSINTVNKTVLVKNNYSLLENIKNSNGNYVLRITVSSSVLIQEGFVQHLFLRLLHQKSDTITRFIMLYQIIEISISKILHLKVQSEICGKLHTLTSIKLKRFLGEIEKEKPRINFTLTDFARPTTALEKLLKQTILDFFIHVQDEDYVDPIKYSELSLVDVFYDYRNKLVHNYRLIHNPVIDISLTEQKMEEINSLTEILVAEIVSNFKSK